MTRRIAFSAFIIIAALLFTSCESSVPSTAIENTSAGMDKPVSSIEKPATSIEKASETASETTAEIAAKKTLMDEYKELMDKNSPPSEIITFSKKNIGSLGNEDADLVITGLRDLQQQKLFECQKKLISEDFNARINNSKLEDLISLNIGDSDLKSFMKEVFDNGLKLYESEGMKELELDYAVLDDDFSGYLSGELAAYISIKSAFTRKHPFEDGGIVITFDELADRTVKMENYLKNYPSGRYKEEVYNMHNQYLGIYLLGLNNTPAFDTSTKIIRQDVLNSYTKTKEKYTGSELAATVTEYLRVLEKSNNKKTREVLQYVGRITNNPEYGTD